MPLSYVFHHKIFTSLLYMELIVRECVHERSSWSVLPTVYSLCVRVCRGADSCVDMGLPYPRIPNCSTPSYLWVVLLRPQSHCSLSALIPIFFFYVPGKTNCSLSFCGNFLGLQTHRRFWVQRPQAYIHIWFS